MFHVVSGRADGGPARGRGFLGALRGRADGFTGRRDRHVRSGAPRGCRYGLPGGADRRRRPTGAYPSSMASAQRIRFGLSHTPPRRNSAGPPAAPDLARHSRFLRRGAASARARSGGTRSDDGGARRAGWHRRASNCFSSGQSARGEVARGGSRVTRAVSRESQVHGRVQEGPVARHRLRYRISPLPVPLPGRAAPAIILEASAGRCAHTHSARSTGGCGRRWDFSGTRDPGAGGVCSSIVGRVVCDRCVGGAMDAGRAGREITPRRHMRARPIPRLIPGRRRVGVRTERRRCLRWPPYWARFFGKRPVNPVRRAPGAASAPCNRPPRALQPGPD